MEKKIKISGNVSDILMIVVYMAGLAMGAGGLVGLLWLCDSLGIAM